jgi:hypothetical protein
MELTLNFIHSGPKNNCCMYGLSAKVFSREYGGTVHRVL